MILSLLVSLAVIYRTHTVNESPSGIQGLNRLSTGSQSKINAGKTRCIIHKIKARHWADDDDYVLNMVSPLRINKVKKGLVAKGLAWSNSFGYQRAPSKRATYLKEKRDKVKKVIGTQR